jgi:REP element-mobilizing transposase RayT
MQATIPLEAGRVYHLYNRGNNREDLFRDAFDYQCFLQQYRKYIQPRVDTLAYCLMGNHFHLMVRIRVAPRVPDDPWDASSRSVSQAFSNYFNAYARTVNQRHKRSGKLFAEHFGRIEVGDEGYFARLVTYIHRNPQRHGFVADFRSWRWSSYAAMCSRGPTLVERTEVLNWYGGLREFENAHQRDEDAAGLISITGPDAMI